MPQSLTRRDFLKIGCGSAVAATLACVGLGVLATVSPDISLVDTQSTGILSAKKILIAYATRAGATVQVAQTIGETLAATGAAVDVRPITRVNDLKGYTAMVIGSAIRMGKWLPEATDFAKSNQSILATMPTACFLVCATLHEDTAETRTKVLAYLDPIRPVLKPKSVGLFAGKMDYGTLSLLDRFIVQNVAKVPQGDWRNGDAIRAWARDLPNTLRA